MLNADLPKIPHGCLGSFKRGMQTVPLKVSGCFLACNFSFLRMLQVSSLDKSQPPTQIQEELGDRLQLSHKLVKVSRHGSLWASTFETPQGMKVSVSIASTCTST